MPISRWTDKQIVAYPYNEIIFIHKMEQHTDICYNLYEPWKHYAKEEKSDTKGHILHDYSYMKHL